MKDIIETGEYFNSDLIRNNRFAAGAIFYCQVVSMFFHGFFVRNQSTLPTSIELPDLLTVTGVGLLLLIGFSLVFSPAKNGLWSSIGFTFFITVLTFQIYDLTNAFWTYSRVTPFNNSITWSQIVPVYLSDRNSALVNTYGNSAVGAFKCALANAVAFAAVIGRAGLLQAFIMSTVGTAVYELNRQIVIRYAFDFGGSISIFCWGGVYGSVVSLILYWRKHNKTAQQHELRVAGKFSYSLTALGALFCWVFFPFLNTDMPVSLRLNYQAGINTFYCITGCVLTSLGISCIINGRLSLRDMVYSPVVGGVIVGSSAGMISNSAGAIILGIVGGIFHLMLQRWERKIKWYFLIQNNVLFLYGVQGMLGGFFSAIFLKIATDSNTSLYSTNAAQYSLYSFSGALIATSSSVGIAIAAGLVVGLVLRAVSFDVKSDLYHDRAFWVIEDDCISSYQDLNIAEEQQWEVDSELSSLKMEIYRQQVIKIEGDFKNKYTQL